MKAERALFREFHSLQRVLQCLNHVQHAEVWLTFKDNTGKQLGISTSDLADPRVA